MARPAGPAGQASLDDVMAGGWQRPDPASRTSADIMGYLRLLPYACGYRGGVPEAARTFPASQGSANSLGQLTLWSVRTTASCGGA